MVRQLRRDGQTGCGRRPRRTAENHSGPPPQDVVQLDGQHQVSSFTLFFYFTGLLSWLNFEKKKKNEIHQQPRKILTREGIEKKTDSQQRAY